MSKTIQKIELRQDVWESLNRLVMSAPLKKAANHDRFLAYQSAKRTLSRLCGWDAPNSRFDPAQYDLAVSEYLRRVDL